MRNCITSLTAPSGLTSAGASASASAHQGNFPQPLATALFSFLYHLASYEAGGEALVSCGMMESLLKVYLVRIHFFLKNMFKGQVFFTVAKKLKPREN